MARMDHVTQIGNPGEEKGIYLEDYAYTYLKKQQDTDRKKYYLYGKKEVTDGKERWYIYGISDSPREENRYFKNWYSLGTLRIKNKEKYLVGKRGEEIHLTGFYVFYAPNQGMQEYLIDNSKVTREEERVISAVEKQRKEKKTVAAKRPESFGRYFLERKKKPDIGNVVFFTGCVFALILLAVAITSGNGYGKLADLKEMVYYAMSDSLEETEEFIVEEQPAVSSSELAAEASESSVSETTADVPEGSAAETVANTVEGQPMEAEAAVNTAESQTAETVVDTAASQPVADSAGNSAEAFRQESVQEVISPASTVSVEQEEYESYIVQEGDTLAGICQLHYGNTAKLKEVCEYNGIENEDHIAPGQKLYLP